MAQFHTINTTRPFSPPGFQPIGGVDELIARMERSDRPHSVEQKSRPFMQEERILLKKGLDYLQGTGGVGLAPKEAIKCFEKAAAQKLPDAQLLLGILYLSRSGKTVGFNPVKAFDYLKEAAENSVDFAYRSMAEHHLARLYLAGVKGGKPDPEEALKNLTLSANRGNLDAACDLGVFYRDGHNGEPDKIKALEYFRAASQKGHLLAKYCFAFEYFYMRSIEPNASDDEIAFEYFNDALDMDFLFVKYFIACMYLMNRGGRRTKEEDKRIFEYLRQEAEHEELPDASYNLALMHLEGRGVTPGKKADKEAARYLKRAATRDIVAASHALVDLYAERRGFEPGKEAAEDRLRYMQIAALHGAKKAFGVVGRIYEIGDGVDPDNFEALISYLRGAIRGDAYAVDRLQDEKFVYALEGVKKYFEIQSKNEVQLDENQKQEEAASKTAPNVLPHENSSSVESKDKIQAPFSAAADAKAIGKMLTAVRVEAGMTKVAVADEMDTGPRSIVRLENGEQNPTVQTLQRFAKALGYTVRIELIKNDLD